MIITIEEKQGVSILTLSGRLDAANANDLKDKFKNIKISKPQYVFDLENVNFIDSTGLGSIVSCLKNAVEQNGTIKIATLQPKPRMVFEITRAYKIFDMFDDVDSAIKSYL